MLSESDLNHKIAQFGAYELDCRSGRLSTNGQVQNLEPLVFRFLLLLLQYCGEVVPKQVVLDTLWQHKTPSDEALRAMVKKTREALKDDAKAPSYIKTIPTKGYRLIPNAVLRSTIVKTWLERNQKNVVLVGLLVTALGLALYLSFFLTRESEVITPSLTLQVTELSQFRPGEVGTYYINGTLKTLDLEQNSVTNNSVLTSVDVDTKSQVNVAFPRAVGRDFWWSSAAQTLLVTRNDNAGAYGIKFGSTSAESTVIEYSYIIEPNTRILSLSSQGNHIFLLNQNEQRIELRALENGAILSYLDLSLISEAPTALDYSSLKVWPNPSGVDMILSAKVDNIINLFSVPVSNEGMPIKITNLVNGLQSGIWDKEGKRFSFSDNQGLLFSYQNVSKRITTWNTAGRNITVLIADCGDACFIVSETQGVPKLSERLNPFDSDPDRAVISYSNTTASAESLPLYVDNGLFFIRESNDGTYLIFRNEASQELVQHSFTKQSVIDEFTVSNSGNTIVGLLNNRPFQLDLISSKLSFLGITFPQISHLHFNGKDNLRFYATPSNKPKGLYEYDMFSKQVKLISEDFVAMHSLVINEVVDTVTVRHKATFKLDKANFAHIDFNNYRENMELGELNNSCVNCYSLRDKFVYQVQIGVPNLLIRTDLLTGETATQTLFLADLNTPFFISPDSKRVVFSYRQALQTKLSKIEGLVQVY